LPKPGPEGRPAKPDWLKIRLSSGPGLDKVERAISRHHLHTVCQEALCPNRNECFGRGTATFLLLGGVCTRRCTFCNVTKGRPQPLDPGEPEETARAAAELGLKFVVLTSVTRDDVPDGGASVFARTIEALRRAIPGVGVEVLIPDFGGDDKALAQVVAVRPEVLNHNLETVARLYPRVRPRADYARSLRLLARVKELAPDMVTKSGLMLGLGEGEAEVGTALRDLRASEVDLLTLGQYLSPSKAHHPVIDYVTPERFAAWQEEALALGFAGCASGPLVRSSYQAQRLFVEARA